MVKRICKTCKKSFTTKIRNKKTCTEKCRVIRAKKIKHEYNMRPYVRKKLLEYLKSPKVRDRINKKAREETRIKKEKRIG